MVSNLRHSPRFARGEFAVGCIWRPRYMSITSAFFSLPVIKDDGDSDQALIHYMLLGEMGYEVAQHNAAFLLDTGECE